MLPLKEKKKLLCTLTSAGADLAQKKKHTEMWGSSSGLQSLPVFPGSTSWAAESSQRPNLTVSNSSECSHNRSSFPLIVCAHQHWSLLCATSSPGSHRPPFWFPSAPERFLCELPRCHQQHLWCWSGHNSPAA